MDEGFLSTILAGLVEASQTMSESARAHKKNPEKVRKFFADIGGWGHLYELPITHLLVASMIVLGWVDQVTAAAASNDPNRTLWDSIDTDEAVNNVEALAEEEQAIVWALVFAVIGNITARGMFNRWLSDLVSDAARGDDEALFNAVVADRVAVQSRPIAGRISEAQMVGDESFMNRLAKAITRTRPRRPKPEYDLARYMLDVIHELVGPGEITHEALYHVLVEKLRLYPDDGKDPMSGLKKLIQKRNRQVGK
jgi:hypothetical protein